MAERPHWKDHPLAIATLSAAAAMVFMATVVMPINNTFLTNRLAEIEGKAKKIEEIERSLKDAQEKLKKTEGELQAVINVNLFSRGSPYPNGLSDIKVGDPITKIDATFSEESIDRKGKSYYSVKVKHPVFNDITFYFDSKNKAPRVTHILLIVDYNLKSGDMLQRKLVDALGEPKVWEVAQFLSWKIEDGTNVYKKNDTSYIIMEKASHPAIWPDK